MAASIHPTDTSNNLHRTPAAARPVLDTLAGVPEEFRIEERLKQSNAGTMTGPGGQYLVDGVRYASCSEAACALLMERFIPGFQITPGKSYQIEAGSNERGAHYYVDFEVQGVLFEFHPPRLWRSGKRLGDFASLAERKEFYRSFRKAKKGSARRELKDAMQAKMADTYTAKRRALLDRHPEHRDKELIVARNEAEFFEKVIQRFAPEHPGKEAFLVLFRQCTRDVHRYARSPE